MATVTKSRKKRAKKVKNVIELELFKCDHIEQVLVQIGPNRINLNGASDNSLKKLELGTIKDLCK